MNTTAKRVAIYARVSTDDQTVDNQIAELNAAALRNGWNVVAVFRDDGISGTKGREGRPALDAMLTAVSRREVDMVAAWSVDRLGRTLSGLCLFLGELKAKGVDLFLLKQGLDTSTPSGRAMFGMLGVFAEFEAEMIRERVRAGIKRAKLHGTKSGKPFGRPRVSEKKKHACRALLNANIGVNRAAKMSGIGTGTAFILKQEIDAAKAGVRTITSDMPLA